jgi:hypothetical protein
MKTKCKPQLMRLTKLNSKAETFELTKHAHAKIAHAQVAVAAATAEAAVVAPVAAADTAVAVDAPVAAADTAAAVAAVETVVAVVVATAAIAGNFGYQATPKSLDSKSPGIFCKSLNKTS